MKFKPSAAFVKQSLSSHSWIGLLVGALMYLVCLSGTLAVFYQEFERWEQPDVDEFVDYDPAIVDGAYRELVASGALDVTHHMYVGLPTGDMPRLSISSEAEGRFVNRDGTIGQTINHDWTHLLLNLHLYLHLPISFGMVVVSALGALLVGLIVSGFCAHPSVLRDAFNLRMKGSRRLEQVDIHNRLGVWGAPFHLMIAITGAFFGLALLIAAVLAQSFYGGDTDALMADVYGGVYELEQPGGDPEIAAAIADTAERAPGRDPFYVTIDRADEPAEQFMIVGTDHRERLIWGEEYRFDASGAFLDKAGWSDGEAGRQALYSVYRLHFGHFGGFFVKIVYAAFGLALTVVSVTGINIWFARRKTRDALNDLWAGFVWGAPAALALTGLTQVVFEWPSTLLFWLALAGTMAFARLIRDEARVRYALLGTTAALLGALVVAHTAKFGRDAIGPAALGVNATMLVTALVLGIVAFKLRGQLAARAPVEARRAPA